LRLCTFCAFAVWPASPTPAYNMPSGPKAIRPPLWILALARPLSTTSGVCGLASRKRTMRLSALAVKYA
jgi:hypothetical protein